MRHGGIGRAAVEFRAQEMVHGTGDDAALVGIHRTRYTIGRSGGGKGDCQEKTGKKTAA